MYNSQGNGSSLHGYDNRLHVINIHDIVISPIANKMTGRVRSRHNISATTLPSSCRTQPMYTYLHTYFQILDRSNAGSLYTITRIIRRAADKVYPNFNQITKLYFIKQN